MERRRLALRRLDDFAEHLRARRLIEPRALDEAADPDGLEQPQRAERVGVRRVLGGLERHGDMALRREVVDLLRSDFLHDANEVRRIGQVAVVQDHAPVGFVRIAIEVIDAVAC